MSGSELQEYWDGLLSNAKHGVEDRVEREVRRTVRSKAESAAPAAAGVAVGVLLVSLAFRASSS